LSAIDVDDADGRRAVRKTEVKSDAYRAGAKKKEPAALALASMHIAVAGLRLHAPGPIPSVFRRSSQGRSACRSECHGGKGLCRQTFFL